MSKEDKLQLIKWITLCALSFLLCAYGFILQLNGYGKTGQIKQDLNKVIKVYNSLTQVKNNVANIKAKYKNKSIVVDYITDQVEIEYTFKYEKIQNHKTLSISYKEGDSTRAEDVIKAMIEAISVTQGNSEGKVFSQYKYKNFYQTKLEHGVFIQSNGGFITTQIVLETNLLENIKDIFFEESYTTHISIEDLKDLEKDLKNNEKFLLLKGNVMLYVVETDTEYLIYSSDKEQNKKNIYESMMSVISILDSTIYNDILNSKIDITDESIRKNYYSKPNPETIKYNQQMNNDFVASVIITKTNK